jgi:hypothetical protein
VEQARVVCGGACWHGGHVGTSFLHKISDLSNKKPLKFLSRTKQPQQAFGVLSKQKETQKRTLKGKKKIVQSGNKGLKEEPRQ